MSRNALATDAHLGFEEVVAARAIPRRDCRDCARYEPDPDGLGCGWCSAHEQWVKLYRSPDPWFTQCQFKTIRVVRRMRDA